MESQLEREVAVVDVGLGNHASVANMLRYVGALPTIARSPSEVRGRKVILPGVGAFDRGMKGLEDAGWVTFLQEFSVTGDLLGICLGMQLLGEGSEEGVKPGLGLIPMHFTRLDPGQVRVPHMGWNDVDVINPDTLFPPESGEHRFYFAHSYRAHCEEAVTIAEVNYGGRFPCATRCGRVAGVQFHPEKSHRFGMDLLRRFVGE